MFAKCFPLQGFQGVTATVILCSVGTTYRVPDTIWWVWRMSGSHSAENISFYSSRILQAPAWHFYTIWKSVRWSCACTSKGNDPGDVPCPRTSCLLGIASGVLYLPSLTGASPGKIVIGMGWNFTKDHFGDFMGWMIMFHLNYQDGHTHGSERRSLSAGWHKWKGTGPCLPPVLYLYQQI